MINYNTIQCENSLSFQYLIEELGKSGFRRVIPTLDNTDILVYQHRETYKDYAVHLNPRTLTADIYYRNDKLYVTDDNKLTSDIPFTPYALEPHDIAAVLAGD